VKSATTAAFAFSTVADSWAILLSGMGTASRSDGEASCASATPVRLKAAATAQVRMRPIFMFDSLKADIGGLSPTTPDEIAMSGRAYLADSS
jgi:hypothetical protein